jgi:hypothetical protein
MVRAAPPAARIVTVSAWPSVKVVDRKSSGPKPLATSFTNPVRTAALGQPAWLTQTREVAQQPHPVQSPIAPQHIAPPALTMTELASALAARAEPTGESTMLVMFSPATAFSGLRARQLD